MGQKQDKLLKRIQKLVRQNQELLNSNEKLRKAVNELTEKNESMKLQLKEARLEVKPGVLSEVQERAKKYNMATVLFAYISGFKQLTDDDDADRPGPLGEGRQSDTAIQTGAQEREKKGPTSGGKQPIGKDWQRCQP